MFLFHDVSMNSKLQREGEGEMQYVPVGTVVVRLAFTAYLGVFLKDDGGVTLGLELVCDGESSRAGADDTDWIFLGLDT